MEAVRYPEDPAKIAKLSPQIALTEIPDGSKVPYLDASTITIIPHDWPGADIATDTPSTVSGQGTSNR
jgi:hypothetical protein